MPPSALSEGLLRIMDENGEPLSAERLFKVQAQFQNQAGQRSSLALSPQACIRLPQEQGLVLVSLPTERKALVHPLPTSEPTFMRKNLQSASGLSTAFSCSNDGFFANQSLRHDWSFESTVSAQTLKLVVRAIGEKEGQTQNLFTQDFGASTLQLPDTLDISALREGVYRLEVDAYDLLDNFGETPRSLIKKNCPLTVLRRSPWVGGLVDTS
ncbi:MAG: hypothetical protein M3Q07_15105, partial [Pseudobdellovibrionaceae bacterium]|nr:hypothetical protein [Pseudobdellovibrionaceae bacterium]